MIRYYISGFRDTGDTRIGKIRWVPLIDNVVKRGWSVVDGRPDKASVSGHCFVQADVTDEQHAALLAEPGIVYLPLEDVSGTPLSASDPIGQVANRAALRSRLEARGVDLDDLTLADPIGLLLRRIVQRLTLRARLRADDFGDALDVTVGSLPAARRQAITAQIQAEGYDTSVIRGPDTIRQALRKLFAQNVTANRTYLG